MSEEPALKDISVKIGLLEARAAIADLVYQYALNIRSGKAGDCAMLFTGDAVFDIGEIAFSRSGQRRTRTRLEGCDSILDYLTRGDATTARVCPVIYNLLVTVDGDRASSSCVMTTVLPEEHRIVGEYEDKYRYDGRWLFSSRAFTIFV